MIKSLSSLPRRKKFAGFWLFFRLTFLVVVAFFLFKIPGTFSFTLQNGWSLTISAPLAIGGLCGIFAVIYFLLGMMRSVFGMGDFFRDYFSVKRKKIAEHAFKEGLCYFFAKDFERAHLCFKKTHENDPLEQELCEVFLGLCAQQKHDHDIAFDLFEKLTHSKDFKFLGYYGLVQISSDPLEILEKAHREMPENLWMRDALFALYVQNSTVVHVNKAKNMLAKGLFSRQLRRGREAEIALMERTLAQKDGDKEKAKFYGERAYAHDRHNLSAVIAYAEDLPSLKATKVLLDAYVNQPCAVLAEAIQKILPLSVETFQMFEKALDTSMEPQGIFLLGILAFHAHLWGRAREILARMPKERRDARYDLLIYNIHHAEKK